jgi:uncharacterized protein
MNSGSEAMIIKDTTANPAPVGLLGFALTTILLNMHNAGLFGMNSMILATGIFVGGAAQVIVGIMEWKKNNTFGTTAFIAYGFFWMTLVGLIVMPKLGIGVASDPTSMAAFLAVWGLFTVGMFVGTFALNRALQVVFGTLTLLFFLLAYSDMTGNAAVKIFAGYEGILCGLAALYTSMAQVLNELFGKIVLPLGPVKRR